ncbi:MAG: hypothetical protein IT514_04515 [Burkholderiales bacterium]|nr:hypothetical protein [Burkholderiales bacterium]
MRLGVDVGGTGTDVVLLDDANGGSITDQCLTTPRAASQAIQAGLRALQAEQPGCVERLERVIHGTTLVINALIERKGAPQAAASASATPQVRPALVCIALVCSGCG